MKPLDDLTTQCIRCGFCLDACPTFKLTGSELESPGAESIWPEARMKASSIGPRQNLTSTVALAAWPANRLAPAP